MRRIVIVLGIVATLAAAAFAVHRRSERQAALRQQRDELVRAREHAARYAYWMNVRELRVLRLARAIPSREAWAEGLIPEVEKAAQEARADYLAACRACAEPQRCEQETRLLETGTENAGSWTACPAP